MILSFLSCYLLHKGKSGACPPQSHKHVIRFTGLKKHACKQKNKEIVAGYSNKQESSSKRK